jgi:hypothetical protein
MSRARKGRFGPLISKLAQFLCSWAGCRQAFLGRNWPKRLLKAGIPSPEHILPPPAWGRHRLTL